jgi:hypothetical protein
METDNKETLLAFVDEIGDKGHSKKAPKTQHTEKLGVRGYNVLLDKFV